MKSVVYWIDSTFPGRLALVPRPRGAVVPETEEQRRWVAEFGRHFAVTRATESVTAVHG